MAAAWLFLAVAGITGVSAAADHDALIEGEPVALDRLDREA